MKCWLDYHRLIIEGNLESDMQKDIGQRYSDMGQELKDHGNYVKKVAQQNNKVRKMFRDKIKEGETIVFYDEDDDDYDVLWGKWVLEVMFGPKVRAGK